MSAQSTPVTAVIYVRQSRDRFSDELGVDRQLAKCRDLATRHGFEVVETISDNNITASKKGRPGYARLLDLMASGSVRFVLILRIDRLLRLNDELEQLITLSETTCVKVMTVEGEIDLSTPGGRLVARILVSVARAEMEVKSQRHKLANEQKAVMGKPHGSRRPYGYESDLTTIYEPEASVLREMASRIIAGHSYKDVAWWLNREGHKTTLGKLWYPITVRNMMRKKRYASIREYAGTEYAGNWEPVFSDETWQQLQLVMNLRSELAGDVPKARKYLLTGITFCGNCGLPLTGSMVVDRPGAPRRRIYGCRGQRDTGLVRGCGAVRRNAVALEHFIKEAVIYRLESPELASLLSDSSPNDAELRALLDERKAQKHRLDGMVDDYATGLLSRPQLARAKGTAESELKRIEQEINRLNRVGNANGLVSAGESVRSAWDNAGSDEWRRALVSVLVKRITVNKGITKPLYYVDGVRHRFDPSLIDIAWVA